MNNIWLFKFQLISILVYFQLCDHSQNNPSEYVYGKTLKNKSQHNGNILSAAAKIIEIPLLNGFERMKYDSLSFGHYLRHLPLNTSDNNIYSFDGSLLSTGGNHYAIIDLDIGTKNLQQCADAIMRLRGEYLYKSKRYSEIHFNFISDGKARYFADYAKGDYSYKNFRKYLDYIFSYANTSSLKDEMQKVENLNDMKIGDVFIQKGNPVGHAVIIADMAINIETGEKIMLIVQSFMPAQSIHVLLNPNNKKINPWFSIDFEDPLLLSSWNFVKKDLRRFK
jgi:hypothetical protein